MSRTTASRLQVPTMPEGVEVASYRTYLEASGAVDFLSDHGFPVQNLTIVGSGLHLVERVTGRLTMARVAFNGAASGAVWGLFMGILFMMITPERALLTIGMGLLVGAGFGMLAAVVAYTAARGQRDFTSQSQVVASRYAVLATGDVDRAFHELQRTPGNLMRPAPPSPRVVREGPTEYGSRPDEKPRFGVRLSAEQREERGEAGSPADRQRRREERRADAKRPLPVSAEDLRAALGSREGDAAGGAQGQAGRGAEARGSGAARGGDAEANPFAPHERGESGERGGNSGENGGADSGGTSGDSAASNGDRAEGRGGSDQR